VQVEGIDHPVRGVFIRAPLVEAAGPEVRVLAEHEGHPVVLEQGNVVVASFHPELVGETALHEYVLRKV
jgi:5'-phosphate synthase pdxT subunit